MSIFREIASSVYSPDYYKKVTEEKLSTSLSYFVSLALIVSVVVSAIVSLRLLPVVKTALNNFGPEILERFPANLVVTIKNSEISTNSDQPIAIPLHLGSSTLDLPDNFLVIDTQNPFNEARFREAHTLLYVSKDTIYAAKEGGEIEQSTDLNIPDTTIDRPTVLGWLSQIQLALPWIPFLLVIGIFMISIWVCSTLLLELLFGALLIMFFSRYKKMNLGYKKSYQISLHIVTLRLLLNILVVIFPIVFLPLVSLPLFSTALTLILFWINFPSASPTEINESR